MVITSSWCLVLCFQDIGFQICEAYLKAKALAAVDQAPMVGSWSSVLGSLFALVLCFQDIGFQICETYLKAKALAAVDQAPMVGSWSSVLGSLVCRPSHQLRISNKKELQLSLVSTNGWNVRPLTPKQGPSFNKWQTAEFSTQVQQV